MQSTAIYIRTKPEIKKKAQKVAEELGFSLSSLLNAWLRHFIKTKTITFSARDEEIPNAHTLKVLKKAEENYRKGNTSPLFKTGEEAIKWLEDQGI